RQGPAERAVTGIEKQLAQPRAADDRHVVRRRGPQARPPLHYRYSAETGKQLPDPPHDRITTDRVDGSVVSSELGGPRGAQAVAALQPDRVGLSLDRLDHRAVAECDAALRTAAGELLRKAMRIPGFILRRVDAAGDALLGMPQRRLDPQAFGGRLNLPLDAE